MHRTLKRVLALAIAAAGVVYPLAAGAATVIVDWSQLPGLNDLCFTVSGCPVGDLNIRVSSAEDLLVAPFAGIDGAAVYVTYADEGYEIEIHGLTAGEVLSFQLEPLRPVVVNGVVVGVEPWDGLATVFPLAPLSLGSPPPIPGMSYVPGEPAPTFTIPITAADTTGTAFINPVAITGVDVNFPSPYVGNVALGPLTIEDVPEPASLALLAVGLAGLGTVARRRRA